MKLMNYPPRNMSLMKFLPNAFSTVSAFDYLDDYADYMDRLLSEENVTMAIKRVVSNRGCAGVDGMSVKELERDFEDIWSEQEVMLRNGVWRASSLLVVEVEKRNSEDKRRLAIPTVIDRVVHQAVAQVLAADWERVFCEQSYGYRPKRSAGMAVREAVDHLAGEECFAADLDIRSFFDSVNHDILEKKLKKRVNGTSAEMFIDLCLKIVRSPLQVEDTEIETAIGIPQGSPLSPLLANIYLHELDRAMIARGYDYVRYADDMLVVASDKNVAQDALNFCEFYLEQELSLSLNNQKSSMCMATEVEYLGFEFKLEGDRWVVKPKQGVEQEVMESMDILCQQSLLVDDVLRNKLGQLVMGWKQYFGQFEPEVLEWRKVNEYAVKRFRAAYWESWKSGAERLVGLEKLGLEEKKAVSLQGLNLTAKEAAIHPLMVKSIPDDVLKPWGIMIKNAINQSDHHGTASKNRWSWKKREKKKVKPTNPSLPQSEMKGTQTQSEFSPVAKVNVKGEWLNKRSFRMRLGKFFDFEYFHFSKPDPPK